MSAGPLADERPQGTAGPGTTTPPAPASGAPASGVPEEAAGTPGLPDEPVTPVAASRDDEVLDLDQTWIAAPQASAPENAISETAASASPTSGGPAGEAPDHAAPGRWTGIHDTYESTAFGVPAANGADGTGDADEKGPGDHKPDGPVPPPPPVPPAPQGDPAPAPRLPDPAAPPAPAPEAASSEDPEPENERPMTLLEHLTELRTRLLRCFIGIAVGFLLCYGVAGQIFRLLALPLINVLPNDGKLMFTGLPGGFFVELKVAFVAGIFLASPYVFYQIWAFISPGLYEREKRFMLPLSVISALFFLGGAAFCYFAVFPVAFAFFMSYSTDVIVAMPSINEYLSFAVEMLIAFGLIFEMPLFAYFLARMGLLTAAKMRKVRRYAVLGVFIVAAILTPPDVFSQTLMAVPMLLLYELSILVAATVRSEKDCKAESAATKNEAGTENTSAPSPESPESPEASERA